MRVAGKVAFITGAGRGQGRSHAVRLAQEGATIVAIDSCTDVATVAYPMATLDDLNETKRLVEHTGQACLARQVDVRDQAGLNQVVADAVAQFGGIHIVCANAGITSHAKTWELTDDEWNDVIGINLTGVWRTLKAAVPAMIELNEGGSIILTSSSGGLRGIPNHTHYVAAKHGVLGIARTLAMELAEYSIRVNSVHPSAVDTTMIQNPHEYALFAPEKENPTSDDIEPVFRSLNLLPIPWVDAVDVSNAVVWLASDEARYITATSISIDAGATEMYPAIARQQ